MCSESSNIGLVGLKSKSTGKRPSQYCLIHCTQLQLSIVNQAILAWSALSICLQLYLYSESSNIGLGVLDLKNFKNLLQ
jgi:hypothetical protein